LIEKHDDEKIKDDVFQKITVEIMNAVLGIDGKKKSNECPKQ
jgi:hypothetical protein